MNGLIKNNSAVRICKLVHKSAKLNNWRRKMRNYAKTLRYFPALVISTGLLLGCASEPLTVTRIVESPFPAMTVQQVDAFGRCVVSEPVLEEWFIRFENAETTATN